MLTNSYISYYCPKKFNLTSFRQNIVAKLEIQRELYG